MVCAGTASKIEGGFTLVPVEALMACWRACQSKPLGIGDFRAWLACHELVARRCTLDEDRPPSYTVAELARLLGVTERRARESVNRLVDAGLLEWSDEAIGFPSVASTFTEPGKNLADTIGRGRGAVAIPRRMLRFLVSGARPALIATVLGILLRCLSRRRHGFDGRGRVKCSWVAEVFHLSLRQVKAARKELGDLGWILAEESDRWSWNRFGRAYRIDLGWEMPRDSKCGENPHFKPGISQGHEYAPGAHFKYGQGPELKCPTSTPPTADQCASSTPPDLHPELLRERETPGPRPGGTGVKVQSSGRGSLSAMTLIKNEGHDLPVPNLSDVRPEDLKDTARTLKLFDQAVANGLVGDSEHDRLRFLALAEHARVVGMVNPCGLFAALLRRGAWSFVTQAEEDAARRRLREHLRGQGRPPERPQPRVSTFVPDQPAAAPSTLGSVLAGLMGRISPSI